MAKQARRRWSHGVTEHSDALDLRKGVFTWKEPRRIAASLKRSAENSKRRKADPFRSALHPHASQGRATRAVRAGVTRCGRYVGSMSARQKVRRGARIDRLDANSTGPQAGIELGCGPSPGLDPLLHRPTS